MVLELRSLGYPHIGFGDQNGRQMSPSRQHMSPSLATLLSSGPLGNPVRSPRLAPLVTVKVVSRCGEARRGENNIQ